MKHIAYKSFSIIILIFLSATLYSFNSQHPQVSKLDLPYAKAGLTKREAAAHLLSRFSFGARPGEVDKVVEMGLEKWLDQQLNTTLPDEKSNALLANYETMKMSDQDIVKTFPKPGQLLRQASKEGLIDIDSAKTGSKKDYRDEVRNYMLANNLKPQTELFRQLINQKIIRAMYSENQLQEVLTDFWFNHFNVSLTKGESKEFITSYERGVIRPNVLGDFETLLVATAKSPAMLTFLDNFRSTGVNEKLQAQQERRQQFMLQQLEKRQAMDSSMQKMDVVGRIKNAKKSAGLNENYAREIMELHTLGVDGGYTQADVTEAAGILTGWTIYPMGPYGGPMVKQLEKMGETRLKKAGFVHEGDFVFAANNHDAGSKKVLGVGFPSGGGYEEGVKLLHMLATHPSTATFISKKLATRFVSDNPPTSLVNKMASTFKEKNGNIKEVIITMVNSPEFWNKSSIREKTKSPYEVAISALRGLDATVNAPFQVYNWITKMGEKMYYYQAPTGYPDRGQYWINTGSLLNRMNFGLALATGRIPGVSINLVALNNNHEPESTDAALYIYSKILLPGRDVTETIKRLKPLLNDPTLASKLDEAADKSSSPNSMNTQDVEMNMNLEKKRNKNNIKGINKKGEVKGLLEQPGTNSMLAQAVGIIIGSPEFQRR